MPSETTRVASSTSATAHLQRSNNDSVVQYFRSSAIARTSDSRSPRIGHVGSAT